ncbi:hypothetical protein RhiJN_28389 [Ceratobasidium sp. AG-Ba]|nr:hypothetical protein RhiJN_28389 [Ceratobasidium sp. AG-Ba]
MLLAHAARVAPLYTRTIFSHMRKSGITWSSTTQKLAVRAHIRAGEWEQAIKLAEQTWVPVGKLGPSTIPLDVFIELMHLALTPSHSRGDVAAMAERCWRLFPSRAKTNASPRLAYNVVRLLVNQGHTDQAIQLTKRLLKSLKDVTPSTNRYCRAILGLVIRPPERSARRSRPYSAPSFKQSQALFESLLAYNPALGLTPDAKLTRYLLENLFRSRNRGSRAAHTLGELRAKYGPGVEDSAVRRLIARYAMQDGNIRLAKAMHEQELLARRKSSHTFAEAGPSRSKDAPWSGDEPIPIQSHLEYIRNIGTENVKWTKLSRGLRRAEVGRGLIRAGEARKRRSATVRLNTRRKLLNRVRKMKKV